MTGTAVAHHRTLEKIGGEGMGVFYAAGGGNENG